MDPSSYESNRPLGGDVELLKLNLLLAQKENNKPEQRESWLDAVVYMFSAVFFPLLAGSDGARSVTSDTRRFISKVCVDESIWSCPALIARIHVVSF